MLSTWFGPCCDGRLMSKTGTLVTTLYGLLAACAWMGCSDRVADRPIDRPDPSRGDFASVEALAEAMRVARCDVVARCGGGDHATCLASTRFWGFEDPDDLPYVA